jgi:hypothetical protein
MVTYHIESAASAFDEIMPLLQLHWREIAHYQDIVVDPDVEGYLKAEEGGNLRVYTYRVDSALVGYAVFFIRHNMHYKRSLQAVQDVLFIQKEYRGNGKTFIEWCDEQLAIEGVQVVYHHIKAAHNWSKVLEKMNYELVDLIYAKRLD